MAAREFELIDRYLSAIGTPRADVALGIGDDAALLDVAGGGRVHVAVATALGGDCARALAEQCFEGARAGLADAGVAPRWGALALSLEGGDEAWVERFSAALHAHCRAAGIAVVGGDTTRGPTAATLFLLGLGDAATRLR